MVTLPFMFSLESYFFFLLQMQKIEARVAADEDLKLADLLKYYLRESQAAKVKCHFLLDESNYKDNNFKSELPCLPRAISHPLWVGPPMSLK